MFAVAIATTQLLVWLVGVQHVPNVPRELSLFADVLPTWAAWVFSNWLRYLALEPYVRRYWPQVLISWTRIVNGQFRDRLVGRELLIGSLAGILFAVIANGFLRILTNVGDPTGNLEAGSLLQLTGALLDTAERGIFWGVWYLMVLLVIRSILRDSRLTIVGVTLLFAAFALLQPKELQQPGFPWACVGFGLWALGAALVMTRCGLIGAIAYFFSQQLLEIYPITADVTEWYGSGNPGGGGKHQRACGLRILHVSGRPVLLQLDRRHCDVVDS